MSYSQRRYYVSILSVDELVSMYLNKAGRVNAQFTIHFKEASEEIQDAVLARIAALGLRPYAITRCPDHGEAESIRELLVEIEKDKAKAADWLKTVETAEQYYRKKLLALESSGSAGATRHKKTDSIGQAVCTAAPCDTCSSVS